MGSQVQTKNKSELYESHQFDFYSAKVVINLIPSTTLTKFNFKEKPLKTKRLCESWLMISVVMRGIKKKRYYMVQCYRF